MESEKFFPLKGEHLMLSLRVSDDLEQTEKLKNILLEAIQKSNAHVLSFVEHKFTPRGYSIVILISESHASIHTYPEVNGLFIDYFTCGDVKTSVFKNHILKKLNVVKIIEDETISRGESLFP